MKRSLGIALVALTLTLAGCSTPAVSASEFESGLKSSLGVTSFAELYTVDPSLWGGYVNGIRVEGNNAYVTLQVSATDPLRDELGKRAAKAISTVMPADAVEGISWIIVEDAAGTAISQEQPNPAS